MAKIYNSLISKELESFYNAVAEKVLQNDVSLFVGAGSSMQYGFMSWNELIEKIRLSSDLINFSDKWNNTDLAQCIELEGIDIKWKVCNIINNTSTKKKNNNTFLNYVLDFDFKSIWTTNYDCIIEKILDEKNKDYTTIYRYEHFRSLSNLGGLFIYKINGSTTSPESIVITHEHFINYKHSHEAYLILLKRELLCHSMLFLGCSFNDDILRNCIKDILNCIENSGENYTTKHYAIVAETDIEHLNYLCKDLSIHYNINCLKVSKPELSYLVTQGIANKAKLSTIFISGAKMLERYSKDEQSCKKVCQELISELMCVETMPFKIVSGMGMSIGHFISGSVKQNCNNKNINRYLDMEPFPFTNEKDNNRHRVSIMSKAGIFIFLYGDKMINFESSGMWKEYQIAKRNKESIIISLPCGDNSISEAIYKEELKDTKSFVSNNIDCFKLFTNNNSNKEFFKKLVKALLIEARKKMDCIIESTVNYLK